MATGMTAQDVDDLALAPERSAHDVFEELRCDWPLLSPDDIGTLCSALEQSPAPAWFRIDPRFLKGVDYLCDAGFTRAGARALPGAAGASSRGIGTNAFTGGGAIGAAGITGGGAPGGGGRSAFASTFLESSSSVSVATGGGGGASPEVFFAAFFASALRRRNSSSWRGRGRDHAGMGGEGATSGEIRRAESRHGTGRGVRSDDAKPRWAPGIERLTRDDAHLLLPRVERGLLIHRDRLVRGYPQP